MRYLIFFSLFVFSISNSFAQVKEMKRSMSNGNKNAVSLDVANADEKLVSDVWKSFLKDNYKGKTKYDRRSKEYFTDDVKIPAIGQGNTVDIYATIEEKGTDATLYVWYNLGGSYLSSYEHSNRFDAAEKMILRLGLEVEKEKVRQEISAEEKNMKDMEKDLKRLESENDKLHKAIEKAKKEILEAEEKIAQNLEEQVIAKEKIQEQSNVVDKVREKLKSIN